MLSKIYSVYKKLVGKVGLQWFSWHLVKFGIWGCWLKSCRGGGGGGGGALHRLSERDVLSTACCW